MGIDSTIKKMEETLKKKKALRAEKDKAKLASLKDRVKAKTEKIEKIQAEVGNLNTEIEQLKVRMSAEGEEKTEELKPGLAAESKDPAAKNPSKK